MAHSIMPAPESPHPVPAFAAGTQFIIAALPPLFFWGSFRSIPNDETAFQIARQRLFDIEVLNSRGGPLMWAS